LTKPKRGNGAGDPGENPRDSGIGTGVGRAAAAARLHAVRTALSHDLIRAGRILERRGMIVATEGNMSARISAERILITRRGRRKGELTPRDFVEIGLAEAEGSQARAAASTEHRMHLAAYIARPDIEALVHAHPPGLSAYAVRAEIPDVAALDEAREVVRAIALVPYAPSGTEILGVAVAAALPGHDVLILRNHGALAVGGSVEEALSKIEIAEHLAMTLLLAERRG